MKKNLLIGSFLVIIFVFHEYLKYVYPETTVIRSLLKFTISIVPVINLINGLQTNENNRNKFYYTLLFAMITCCVGDMAINYSVIAGIALFMAAQVLIILAFSSGRRLSVAKIGLWVALWLSSILACYALFDENSPDMMVVVGGMIYIGIMFMMVISSYGHSHRIFIGALLFGLSDLLLVYNTLTSEMLITHALSLGLYYVGIIIISSDIYSNIRKEVE